MGNKIDRLFPFLIDQVLLDVIMPRDLLSKVRGVLDRPRP